MRTIIKKIIRFFNTEIDIFDIISMLAFICLLAYILFTLGIEYEKLKKNLLKEVKLDIETYLTTFYRPK